MEEIDMATDPLGTLLQKLKPSDIEYAGQLGSGGQAIVYAGKVKGFSFAIKAISREEEQQPNQELVTLRALTHPNIVRYLGHMELSAAQCKTVNNNFAFSSWNKPTLLIFMELFQSSSLRAVIDTR